jgi:hypothetical protein
LTREELQTFNLALPELVEPTEDVESFANPAAIQQMLQVLRSAAVLRNSKPLAQLAAAESHDSVLQALLQLASLAGARAPVLRNPQFYSSILHALLPVAAQHERHDFDLVFPTLDTALIHTITRFVIFASKDSDSEAVAANIEPQAINELVDDASAAFAEGSAASCVPGNRHPATAFSAARPAHPCSGPPFRCDDDSLSNVLCFLPPRDWFTAIRCWRQQYALRVRASAWPARPRLPSVAIVQALAHHIRPSDSCVHQGC